MACVMERKDAALQALATASAFLKSQFRFVQTGTPKSDGTMVSSADLGSEDQLFFVLRKAFPQDAILSEESGEISGTSGYRWIMDPLDGTHNFLASIPIFGILLALEYQGSIVLSGCVFPMIDEVWFAEKGKGTVLNGDPVQVSPAASVDGSVFFADGNKKLPLDVVCQDIRPFYNKGCRSRLLGESAFGMTRVACGTAVVATMRLCHPWDIAAPCLIVEEAGGRVTDFLGRPWTMESRSLVATNGLVHDAVLPLFTDRT